MWADIKDCSLKSLSDHITLLLPLKPRKNSAVLGWPGVLSWSGPGYPSRCFLHHFPSSQRVTARLVPFPHLSSTCSLLLPFILGLLLLPLVDTCSFFSSQLKHSCFKTCVPILNLWVNIHVVTSCLLAPLTGKLSTLAGLYVLDT